MAGRSTGSLDSQPVTESKTQPVSTFLRVAAGVFAVIAICFGAACLIGYFLPDRKWVPPIVPGATMTLVYAFCGLFSGVKVLRVAISGRSEVLGRRK
jgi:hypothetical protein